MPHLRTETVAGYTPQRITAAAATAKPLGGNVTTTSATTITAGNAVTVTPASMANIQQGMLLNFSGGTGGAEDVTVLSVNEVSGTFTANFVNNHSGSYNIVSARPQYLGTLVVNAAGTISAINLFNGSPLLYNGGTGAGVQIAAIGTPTSGQVYIYNCYCNRGLFYTATGAGDHSHEAEDRGPELLTGGPTLGTWGPTIRTQGPATQEET